MYKIINNEYNEIIVKLNEDGSMSSFLPDPANTDYQAYLAWAAKGNEAEEWTPEGIIE